MSVWKTASYRDDTLQHFLRNTARRYWNTRVGYELCDFQIEEFGNFPVPNGISAGNLKAQAEADKTIIPRIASLRKINLTESLYHTLDTAERIKFGVHGVYHFIKQVYPQLFRHAEITAQDRQFIKLTFLYGCAAGNHSKNDAHARAETLIQEYETYYSSAQTFTSDLRRAKGWSKNKSYMRAIEHNERRKKALDQVKAPFHPIFLQFNIYSYRNSLILIGKRDKVAYYFLSSDIERICKVINGFANSRIQMSQYANLTKARRITLRDTVARFQDAMVDAMGKVSKQDANSFCRAFDVIYHMKLATFASDFNNRAVTDQQAKFTREDLGRIADPVTFFGIVNTIAPKEQLEILLHYKALPAPDFDYFGAMHRQKTMYDEFAERNRREVDQNAHLFQEILSYHKWMLVHAYHERHGVCPGIIKQEAAEQDWHARYPYLPPGEIPRSEAIDIDLRGDFYWPEKGYDCLDLVKDKSLCAKNIRNMDNAQMYAKLPLSDRNQLINFFQQGDAYDLTAIENVRQSLFYDVKGDDKPEAKKPNGRMFFIAGPEARLKQSEYELAIGDYTSGVPGSIVGLNYSEKLNLLNMVSEIQHDFVPTKPLMISFDLEKFSPGLPSFVHRVLDEQWAEAFGVPGLLHAHSIFTNGKIHYIKNNIHHVIDKQGNDFEGFAGKKLTVWHCAVMGYCVSELRRRNLLAGPSRFAAQIDDGVLRLVLEKDNFQNNANECLQVIEQIYNSAGLRISWDKTFVSSNMTVFLNEIRMLGHSVSPGLRTILKMGNRAEEVVASLPADLLYLESTSRGACLAGGTLMSIYSIYVLLVLDALNRWAGRQVKMKGQMSLAVFAPRDLGGFGCVSPMHLAGSLTFDAFTEGLGMLFLIGTRYSDVRHAVNTFISRKVQMHDNEINPLNPLHVMVEGPRLRTDRATKLITRSIVRFARAPVLARIFRAAGSYEAYGAVVMWNAGCVIPVEVIDSIVRADPKHALETVAEKFLKSRTAQAICSRTAIARVVMANISEARKVIDQFAFT